MNVKKIILMLSLLAPIFSNAMETTRIQDKKNQTCLQQACQVAQESAVACCISAPFLSMTALGSALVTNLAYSHVQDPVERAQYIAIGTVAGTALSALVIADSSKQEYNKNKKKKLA